MRMTAIYKCRLCGATHYARTVEVERADSHLAEITAGILSVSVPQMTLLRRHYCGGDHAGSLGLADFLGWQKQNLEED